MIRAGEAGGVIDIITAKLAEFLEKSQELKEYVISAMIYPTILILVGGISVFILLTFVIPKFAKIFSDMGQTLPLSTLILMNISSFIVNYWWVILFGLASAYGLFKMYIETERGKQTWDKFKLRMPLFGSLVERIQIARFARTLGTLVKGGVPLLEGLTIVKEVIENSIISKAMESIREGVKQGDGISVPMKQTGAFPALAVHMLQIGEETGNLDAMLLKVADIYDKEVKGETQRLISLLEPLLILLMGIIIGLIVISMLMAIFSVNELPF